MEDQFEGLGPFLDFNRFLFSFLLLRKTFPNNQHPSGWLHIQTVLFGLFFPLSCSIFLGPKPLDMGEMGSIIIIIILSTRGHA